MTILNRLRAPMSFIHFPDDLIRLILWCALVCLGFYFD